jgi:hypothetical protein
MVFESTVDLPNPSSLLQVERLPYCWIFHPGRTCAKEWTCWRFGLGQCALIVGTWSTRSTAWFVLVSSRRKRRWLGGRVCAITTRVDAEEAHEEKHNEDNEQYCNHWALGWQSARPRFLHPPVLLLHLHNGLPRSCSGNPVENRVVFGFNN